MWIPLGLVYALVPTFAIGATGFATWLVKTVTRNASLIATAAVALNGLDNRVKRLEGFQDGVQYGRAIEAAQHPPKV